jgi:NAD(P)-dependent dehydrogenase (short-subunit alcohol dehydrogenase family)
MTLDPMSFRDRYVLVTGLLLASGGNDHDTRASIARTSSRCLAARTCWRNCGARSRVAPQCAWNRRVYAAVLNAGVTHFGHYDELPWSDFETMLRVNVASTVRLTTGLLPYLGETGEGGGVMLVASMAGMTPVPYQAAYSGTKALRASNLCASVSCPSMRLHAKASRHSGPESSCTCRAGSIASARPC